MRKEKTLCANRGLVERGAPKKTVGKIADRRGKCNSIKIFPQGMQLKVAPIRTPSVMSGGGVRGEVVGWSSASRRRMREWMLTHTTIAGMRSYGVTLTIPGPVLDPEKAKGVFAVFAHNLEKSGCGAVWRLEIQKRGMLHWHLIVGATSSPGIQEMWHAALKTLGHEVFDPPVPMLSSNPAGIMVHECSDRMSWWGASKRAVQVDEGGDSGSWMRYMQDHTTKAKQEQVAINIGRHWGVIGRRFFVEAKAEVLWDLTDSEKARYLRAHQRLATPSEKHFESPFKRRLRARVMRGFRGTTTWFGNPATMLRILDWCNGTLQPESSFNTYSMRMSS